MVKVMYNRLIMGSKKQNIRGFKTLWIQFDKETTDKHQLFFKEHSVRNQDPAYPRGRTLFLLNVPPYITREVLQSVFANVCGNVSNLNFTSPTGFKTAYIVFDKESALESALELPDDYVMIINNEENICLTGIAKWYEEYNRSICKEDEMEQEIQSYMEDYDKRIADKAANEKAMEEAAAENDGWVTVTGRKKRGEYALSRKQSTINKVQHKEAYKNKKKQLLNFYNFQIRESKKQNLVQLRKKFELDKKRLQDLKSKRTFKPF